jgi:hypothetical protein
MRGIKISYRKKIQPAKARIGMRIGRVKRKMYPKKEGILIFEDSAIDLTIRFGPFPI